MYINPQPKPTRLRDKKYLDWLKDQPPLIAGQGDTVYHHVKLFGNGGRGIKPPDDDCLPLAKSVHDLIHSSGKRGGEKQVLLRQHKYTIEILRDLCDAYYRVYQREKAQNG